PEHREVHGQYIARLAAREVRGSLVNSRHFAIGEGRCVEARCAFGILVEPEANGGLRCHGRVLLVNVAPPYCRTDGGRIDTRMRQAALELKVSYRRGWTRSQNCLTTERSRSSKCCSARAAMAGGTPP